MCHHFCTFPVCENPNYEPAEEVEEHATHVQTGQGILLTRSDSDLAVPTNYGAITTVPHAVDECGTFCVLGASPPLTNRTLVVHRILASVPVRSPITMPISKHHWPLFRANCPALCQI
jgi:hypothetical protein